MKNALRLAKPVSKVLTLTFMGVCVSNMAYAERIRHCDYSFSANVKTVDVFGQTQRDEFVLVTGESAGRHGGVQANTARERARDRINSCVSSWINLAANKKSSQLGECTNNNISNAPGFDEITDGNSLREVIADLFPGLCSNPVSDEVQIKVSGGRLLVTGDDGCPATKDFAAENMLRGAFCQGL